MKNIKSNKGITNMTLITIVLVIIILMLLVAVIYLVKNPTTTYITQNSPTEQSELSSTVTENKDNIISIQLSIVYDNNGDPDYKTVDVADTEDFKEISNIINNLTKSKEQIPEGIGLEFSDKIIVKYSDNKTVEYIVSGDNKLYNTIDKTTYTSNKKDLKKYIAKWETGPIENETKREISKISSDKFFKDVDEAYVSKNLKLLSNDKSYSINYGLKGKDSGKIIIKEDNKIISEQKSDKEVVDMYSVYANIYLLLEDGTIGKISLEENDYKLKVLEGYNNIVRIQEVLVGNDEGDGLILSYILVAIDSNGEIKYITVTVD